MWSLILIVAHMIVTGHGGSGPSPQQSGSLAQMGQLLGVISALGLLGLVGVSLARVARSHRAGETGRAAAGTAACGPVSSPGAAILLSVTARRPR
jgi:hypothetical protein